MPRGEGGERRKPRACNRGRLVKTCVGPLPSGGEVTHEEGATMQKSKRAGLYLRVSTGSQDTKAQEGALREYVANRGWTIAKVYADKISGTVSSRPALDELMADCKKRKLDVVLVWKFDRFARSLRH